MSEIIGHKSISIATCNRNFSADICGLRLPQVSLLFCYSLFLDISARVWLSDFLIIQISISQIRLDSNRCHVEITSRSQGCLQENVLFYSYILETQYQIKIQQSPYHFS